MDVLFPVTDDVIQPLAAQRARFEGLCRLAIPDPEALELVSDKARTLELARELDVPVPATCYVRTAEDVAAARDRLRWPVVVKPERSRRLAAGGERLESYQVSYAVDERDLLEQLARFPAGGGFLLQEYCPGEGVGVEMVAHDGEPLAEFQHRRLAEIPISGGASAWRESVALQPELAEYSRRLVRALRWTGPIMVEFKVGERPYLMEINGRVWGSLPLAVLSGVDIPARWAEIGLNGAGPGAPEPPGYEVGLRAYDLERLLMWIGNVLLRRRRQPHVPAPRRRDALRAIACLFDPRQKSDFAAADDPRPARAQLFHIGRKFAKKLLGRP